MILFIISCSKPNNIKNEMVNIDTSINLIIKSNNGEDLLLTTTQNSLNTDNIKLFNLLNGQYIEVNNSNQDYPKNYFIFDYTDSKAIRIFPNDTNTEENPTTLIKWNNIDTDTIKCHFNRGSGNDGSFVICDKVWFNGNLIFPNNQSIGRYLKIVK